MFGLWCSFKIIMSDLCTSAIYTIIMDACLLVTKWCNIIAGDNIISIVRCFVMFGVPWTSWRVSARPTWPVLAKFTRTPAEKWLTPYKIVLEVVPCISVIIIMLMQIRQLSLYFSVSNILIRYDPFNSLQCLIDTQQPYDPRSC